MMKVFSECCKNCLLSPDRIVSSSRAKEIINGCIKEQSYFICHKASIEDKQTVCHTFYNKLGHHSQLIRIMERLNGIEFVPQTDTEKLTPYSKQITKSKRK